MCQLSPSWTFCEAVSFNESMSQMPHHTLLHIEQNTDPPSLSPVAGTKLYANTSTTDGSRGSLLMTCFEPLVLMAPPLSVCTDCSSVSDQVKVAWGAKATKLDSKLHS